MNNKGFTLIELIISVVLIAIIIIPTYAIILNFKNRQQIASDKQELSKFKNLITSDIEDDILQYGLIKLEKVNSSDTEFVANLTFSKKICVTEVEQTTEEGDIIKVCEEEKNLQKKLIINPTKKTIAYGDETYKLAVPYADIVSDDDMRMYYGKGGYIDPVQDNNIDPVQDNNKGISMQYYFQIKIPIRYVNDTDNVESLDYGINIIAERVPE